LPFYLSIADAPTCKECSTDGICVPVKPINSVNYVSCYCKGGSLGNGLTCTKLVYCSNSCCEPGLRFDIATKTCKDNNECQLGTHKCLSGDSPDCVNLNGNYLCSNNRNRACPINACSQEQDCILKGENLQCEDPCDNYSWLDGSKRSYTISSTSKFLTDRYNFGWFRYLDNTGIRTGCVGALKCNSLRPFSLSDPHPTYEEGVKMVSLYSNLEAGCRTAGSIPVKACYKNDERFYVYKFSGLLSYDVYCTDV
uniref:EGF-like domain-containing protein n=1 Tax=Leptobrachium leishanense TaxID=445787 RepID=A0A8C5MAN4_9ANUR